MVPSRQMGIRSTVAQRSLGRVVMVQGTASAVGKSVLVTGLCRLFRQAGYRVVPFKAQNMALNSFATADAREIGRSQAVQAEAAGVAPTVEMNPILLKPEAGGRSQVVLLGRPVSNGNPAEYARRYVERWDIVTKSLDTLRASYDIVVIEGAGSPAEVNLRERDIVNMRVARYAQAPVLLVGDIDRGGVLAALVGTMELLEPDERALVRGFVINKFRGDVAQFAPALDFLKQRTGIPTLGVLPYYRDIRIADEDSVALDERRIVDGATQLDIAVVRLPHISNFDDFAPLGAEPSVRLRYVEQAADLGWPDALIIPGSKSTVADLRFLRAARLDARIVGLAAAGVPVLGICGGYQLLGERILDPHGVEAQERETLGLGLLPVVTTFATEKRTRQVRARVTAKHGPLAAARGADFSAYEIHMGHSQAAPGTRAERLAPFSVTDGEVCYADGFVNTSGTIIGTYLHGLFQDPPVRHALITWLAQSARLGCTLDRSNTHDGNAGGTVRPPRRPAAISPGRASIVQAGWSRTTHRFVSGHIDPQALTWPRPSATVPGRRPREVPCREAKPYRSWRVYGGLPARSQRVVRSWRTFIEAPQPAIIDTGVSSSPRAVIGPALAAAGLDLADTRFVLNTHGHWDHMGGNETLRGVASGVQVVAHPAEERFFHDITAHTRSYRDLVAEVPAFAALATAYTGQFADNITLPPHTLTSGLRPSRRLISAAASSCRPSTCPDTPAASWGTGGQSAGCCLPAMASRDSAARSAAFRSSLPVLPTTAPASHASSSWSRPPSAWDTTSSTVKVSRRRCGAGRPRRASCGRVWRSPSTWPR